MDEIVSHLEKLTDLFIERIDQVTEEEIILFLDDRGALIEQMNLDQLAEADRNRFGPRVMDILKLDGRILDKLNMISEEASVGMSKLEDSKRQKSAYNTYYQHDSIYFDRKK